MLRCGWGPVSDDHSSFGCFPADLSSGCCAGEHVFLTNSSSHFYLNFQNKACQYFTDGGLLRLHDLIRESGLGRRDGPSDWISGGPQ